MTVSVELRRRSRWRLPGLLLAAALTACGDAAAPPPTAAAPAPTLPGDTFTGRVLDAAGRPVADAQLTFVPDVPTLAALGLAPEATADGEYRRPVERLAGTRTGVDGRFEFAVPRTEIAPPARFTHEARRWLLARHAAHAPAAIELPAAAGEAWPGDIVLPAPAAALTGRIVDELGQPVAGVRVRVQPQHASEAHGAPTWSEHLSGDGTLELVRMELDVRPSDAEGRFALAGLAPGRVKARLERAGHAARLLGDIVLEPAGTRDLGTLVLPRGRTLAGLVRDERGQPVPGATLIVVDGFISPDLGHESLHAAGSMLLADDLYRGQRARRQLTGADGRFAFAGLQSPAVALLGAAPGFEPVLQPALDPAAPAEVELRRAGAITVRLVDGGIFGGVPEDARILRVVRVWRSTSGGYELLGVDPLVVLEHDVERATWRVIGLCETQLAVEVAADGYATELLPLPADGREVEGVARLELRPGGVIEGRLVDPLGRPLAGLVCTLRHAPRRHDTRRDLLPDPQPLLADAGVSAVRSDAEGRWRFDGLVPGLWTVALADRGGVSLEVDLAQGARRDIGDLLVPPASGSARITGEVRDQDGQAMAGVRVEGWHVAQGRRRTLTDAAGRFALADLAPGEWSLMAGEVAPPWGRLEVVLADGAEVQQAVRFARGPRVHGRVLRAGEPVPGSRLLASDLEMGARFSTVSTADAQGRFEAERPRDQPWLVLALAPWGGSSPPAIVSGAREEETFADLTLGTGELRGALVAADGGAPLAGVELRLIGPWVDADAPLQVSDAAGRFRFSDLAPHDYLLRPRDPAGRHAALDLGPFHVRDEPHELLLPLPAAASLHAEVRCASGLPAPDGLQADLLRADAPDAPAFARTQVLEGRVTLDGLPPGRWLLRLGRTRAMHAPPTDGLSDCPEFELELAPGEQARPVLELSTFPAEVR